MAVFLVITQSFSTYKRGDIITDQNVIDAIESNPDYENYAVRAGTGTPLTYSAPIAALFGSLGLVAPDTSTVAIDSQGVLRVVSPSGLTNQNVLTALGYTPVNSNLVGANSGLATLDSSGKVTSSQLPANSSGALIYTGTWNANTNSPTLVSSTGSKGTLYKVSADGQTTLDGISSWHAGDFVAFNGSTWDRVSGSKVSSVAGKTGDVSLAATDVSGLATVARTGAYNDLLSPPVFPTKLSQFQNDTNYITTGPLVNYAALTGATFTGPVVLTNLTVGLGGIAPTVSSSDNSTAIATTAFVKNQNYTSLASPNFTGTPTAPTPASSDNSTRLATTNYVTVALQAISSTSGNGTVTSVTSSNTSISVANSSTAPVLTLNPSTIRTSALNNDALFLSQAVTSISSSSAAISIANGTSTAVLTLNTSSINPGAAAAFSASFSVLASHNNNWIEYTGTNGTDTCTLNNIGVGVTVMIEQLGTGVLNFVAGAGMTLTNVTGGTTTQGQYGCVLCRQRSTTVWVISGATN